MDKKRSENGVVGPLILIFAGIIFLFNNLGWISWDIWGAAFQLWPLILVAVGLDLIIGRRSALGSLLVAIVTIGLFAGGLWFLSGQVVPELDPSRSMTIAQPLEGATRADVTISPGIAQLRLESGTDPINLIEGGVQPLRGERVESAFSKDGSLAIYDLESKGGRSVRAFPPRSRAEELWELRLNSDIPMDLTVDTGVGQATLDLSRMDLTELTVHTGVGKTTVSLPRQGDYTANIDGGIGQIVVQVPRGLGVRVAADTGIGSLDIPNGYRKNGDVYTSPEYESASNRVNLTIDGGIGTIQLHESAGE